MGRAMTKRPILSKGVSTMDTPSSGPDALPAWSLLLAEARIGAELKAAQERGEVATQERKASTVRASDGAPASHADLGIPRQRASEMKKLAAARVLGPAHAARLADMGPLWHRGEIEPHAPRLWGLEGQGSAGQASARITARSVRAADTSAPATLPAFQPGRARPSGKPGPKPRAARVVRSGGAPG